MKKKNKKRHKHNQKRGRDKKRQSVKKLMSPETKVKTTDDTIDFAVVKGKERKIARVPLGFIFAFRRSGHTKCNGSGRFLIKSMEKTTTNICRCASFKAQKYAQKVGIVEFENQGRLWLVDGKRPLVSPRYEELLLETVTAAGKPGIELDKLLDTTEQKLLVGDVFFSDDILEGVMQTLLKSEKLIVPIVTAPQTNPPDEEPVPVMVHLPTETDLPDKVIDEQESVDV